MMNDEIKKTIEQNTATKTMIDWLISHLKTNGYEGDSDFVMQELYNIGEGYADCVEDEEDPMWDAQGDPIALIQHGLEYVGEMTPEEKVEYFNESYLQYQSFLRNHSNETPIGATTDIKVLL